MSRFGSSIKRPWLVAWPNNTVSLYMVGDKEGLFLQIIETLRHHGTARILKVKDNATILLVAADSTVVALNDDALNGNEKLTWKSVTLRSVVEVVEGPALAERRPVVESQWQVR